MDFPRAWAIARGTDFFRHNPQCSYAVSRGGMLCDCHVLIQHPEYKKDYGFLKEGVEKKDDQLGTKLLRRVSSAATDFLMTEGRCQIPKSLLDEINDHLGKESEE